VLQIGGVEVFRLTERAGKHPLGPVGVACVDDDLPAVVTVPSSQTLMPYFSRIRRA